MTQDLIDVSFPHIVGPLDLVILQPTSFCNIDCKYCYLPDRDKTRRLSLETIEAIASRIVESDLLRSQVTFTWHAGEPLVVEPEFYAEAIRILREAIPGHVRIQHIVQTNGTLIDEKWCEFFRQHSIRIGFSLDGPKFLHDEVRVRRNGQGTFDTVLRGLERLREADVSFYVLAVLSARSLLHPDEIYEFFSGVGVSDLGFNIEEVEGVNATSSLSQDSEGAFSAFMSRFYDRCYAAENSGLAVREFRQLRSFLMHGDVSGNRQPQQLTPFRILAIDVEGNFSTFSPELLGLQGPPCGDYAFGNVHKDSLRSSLRSKKFLKVYSELREGVEMCRKECSYFPVCGGGAPSNKIGENGTLASTETMYCRLRIKKLVQVVLGKLECQSAGA